MEAAAWLEIDDRGELVGGELVEEEMGSERHEAAIVWLILLLGTWARAHGARLFGQDWKVKLADDVGRKPDLSLFLRPQESLTRPDLVVEVVSPTRKDRARDYDAKRLEYAAAGIRWYLIVDPVATSVVAFELDGAAYKPLWVAVSGQHRVPGCDGLVMDLDDLWTDVETLP